VAELMRVYTFKEHFLELKTRVQRIAIAYFIAFIICYYFSNEIYNVLLEPLAQLSVHNLRKVIYTGLTEAFFTYVKLAAFASFIVIMPLIALECYLFIAPGLYVNEKRIARFIVFMSPVLFWSGSVFVFYFVMPRAWQFFLGFENNSTVVPLILEAKISEYLSLVIQLLVAFGLAFQLPIVVSILNLLRILTRQDLQEKRRVFIVISFVIAGILTPPDVLSQFALAIPMLLLYEISIIMCKFLENRGR
jgi:sec-independent protein translocase protein TatC